jgi:hypothetical protein
MIHGFHLRQLALDSDAQGPCHDAVKLRPNIPPSNLKCHFPKTFTFMDAPALTA